MNATCCDACDEVISLGGDVNAIICSLWECTDEGWRYHLEIDSNQVVTGIWWQSPLQVELTRR